MSRHPYQTIGVFAAFFKLIKFLFGFAAMLLICGFIAFVLHISRAVPPTQMGNADGIVVLTGKGGRLLVGAHLLQEKKAERLFISGVNPAINEGKMKSLLNIDDALYNCCVDLDYVAENTKGNGQQTANWARVLGYENIILVTSAYHMPRAKVEISAAMDGINIIPYPVKVAPKTDQYWWTNIDEWNRLFREYGKLLLSYAREPGARPARKRLETTQ